MCPDVLQFLSYIGSFLPIVGKGEQFPRVK
jgi:hypothetical protein